MKIRKEFFFYAIDGAWQDSLEQSDVFCTEVRFFRISRFDHSQMRLMRQLNNWVRIFSHKFYKSRSKK